MRGMTKSGGPRNGAKAELFDGVRLGGIDVNHDSRELFGSAFLQNCRTFRGGTFIGFPEIEAPRFSTKTHFAVDVRGARGKVFLEKRQKGRFVAAIESGEPAGKLMGCGRIGKLHLREQTAGDQQNYGGQSKLSRVFMRLL